MKRTSCSAIVFAVAGVLIVSNMQAQPELKTVMKVKLIHTQAILEGLALEDFGKIERSAKTLSDLSKATAWKVAKTPEYIKFSGDFQDIANSLAANAKARKLEAATLDYMQLTMLCVKCHTHARKIGVAKGGDFNMPHRQLLAVLDKCRSEAPVTEFHFSVRVHESGHVHSDTIQYSHDELHRTR